MTDDGMLARGAFVEPEIRQATRNHGMLLEALRHDVTPVGLHYLLTHFDLPEVDVAAWTLEVDGLVGRPATWSLEQLRGLPQTERTVTMECAGNGRALQDSRPLSQPWLLEAIGTSCWSGVPLAALLREAELAEGAVEVVFTALDHGVDGGIEQDYQRSLPLELALSGEVQVAIAMNGSPLPPQHGAPARLIVPGWYGMTNVKWLSRITVVDAPFRGYQQIAAYRVRHAPQEAGEPVTRMLPRSLMIPPGIPDFPTRARTVSGPCTLRGRAWSGWAPIAVVDVSLDGGATWEPAELDTSRSDGHTRWCGWEHRWPDPQPGQHVLMCRARDATGNVQPDVADSNLGGYVNNAIQRVPVTVAV
jgi:sulfane dehydrogenase subunit SoxC